MNNAAQGNQFKTAQMKGLMAFITDLNAQGITIDTIAYFSTPPDKRVDNDLFKILNAVLHHAPSEKGIMDLAHKDFPDFIISQDICLTNEFSDNGVEVLGEISYDYDKVPGNADDTPYQPFIDAVMNAHSRYEAYTAELLEQLA